MTIPQSALPFSYYCAVLSFLLLERSCRGHSSPDVFLDPRVRSSHAATWGWSF